MPSTPASRADLQQAYRNSHYHVEDSPGFILRVDHHSAALHALYARMNLHCAAYLTAWNPGSEIQDEARNRAAQTRLFQELSAQGFQALSARAVDPAGHWPDEASLLVMGLPLPAARAFGARYLQNAVLWAGPDAIPHLVWLPATGGKHGKKKPPA